ncbi:hypothetical protein [Sulfodiicoccus acidiphilus]|nr:hypothetical protein [Sulfodiicoccus acidiphilus]
MRSVRKFGSRSFGAVGEDVHTGPLKPSRLAEAGKDFDNLLPS